MNSSIKAIGFDLGGTLNYYPGVPMSWQSLYEQALAEVVMSCGFQLDEKAISAGSVILATYNTRINPRDEEVPSETIFTEILKTWGVPAEQHLTVAGDAFFEFFQRKVAVYEDVIPTLQYIKEEGFRIGVLTDVAYGMSKKFVEREIAPFAEYIDVLLSSVDVGFRKPRREGYLELARRLGVAPGQMMYIGNEPKDILGANNAGMVSVFLDRDHISTTYGEKQKIASLWELRER